MAKTIGTDELVKMLEGADSATTEGETMAEKTPLELAKEAAEGTLERLRAILGEGDWDAFDATADEADAEITAIQTKWKGGTAARKSLRDQLNALKDEAAKAHAAEPIEGTIVERTWEASADEVAQAVEVAAAAVEAHIKAGTAAAQLSEAVWPWRLEIRDKNGNADLRGRSQHYRLQFGRVTAGLRERLDVENSTENREALERLITAAAYHTDHKAVTFARELNEDHERYAELFPAVAAAHPDEEPFAALVAEKIVNEKSRREIAADKARAKALEKSAASAGGEGGESEDGDETDEAQAEETTYVKAVKGVTTLAKATKGLQGLSLGELEKEHKTELGDALREIESILLEIRKGL
jgi:hypothetical protein